MINFRHTEAVMGTMVTFDVRRSEGLGATGDQDLRRDVDVAMGWLHRVDATFSTYRPDSQVSRLDRGELAGDRCDPEVREILELCAELRSTRVL